MESKRRRLSALIVALALLVAVVLVRSVFFLASIPNVSAVDAGQNVGVYRDVGCSQSVRNVSWGTLSPGEVRDIPVYVRNEGNETFVLVLTPLNWSPENASQYLSVALNCEDRKIDVGQVANVTLSLSVSPSITGIYDFSFDIVLEGREFFLGDIDRDGSVDYFDFLLLSGAYGSTSADSNWVPNADLDKDDYIGASDYFLFFQD